MTTHENYDPFFPDQTVVDLYLPLWATLPTFRSKPAFIWIDQTRPPNETRLTYSQLNNSAHFISQNLLSSFHLKKGGTIIILCSPGLDLVKLLFACQRAGLTAVPIYPPDPDFNPDNSTSVTDHLVKAVLETNPNAAIADSSYITRVRRNKFLHQRLRSLLWIQTQDVLLDYSDSNNNNIVSSSLSSYGGCKQNDIYLIQYTSGATGIPKPVLVTAGAAAHNVRAARKAYDLHPNSVIVSWLPQYHDCGLMFLLLTVVSGATCVMTSPMAFVKRPGIWLELISEYRGSCTPVPSFALPLVMKRGGIQKKIDLSSLKNLIVINEPIYNDDVEEFLDFFKGFGLNPMAIAPSYGLAENCTFVSTSWISEFSTVTCSSQSHSLPSYKKLLPSARLSPTSIGEDNDIKILVVNEETNDSVQDGTEGEIWVSSPSNASGYLGHPSQTQEVFGQRIRNTSFVRTGDRGIVLGQERFLFVIGRLADVIKSKFGGDIHPHYIETAAYKSFRNVLRGGCIAAFESSGRIKKIVVTAELLKEGKLVVGSEMLKGICERIDEGVRKETGVEVGFVAIVQNGSIPKTTSGKIKRWAARDKFLGGEMDVLMQMEFGHDDDQEEEIIPKHQFILSSL
ncbi:long-chain-fatty-acid--AMP ligase FadD23-like [Impatiens glandulifera]|uniref:long-chain-fatty-acid--AMP ligase FadD23-like n=1 Tax=Impatiens glandulifera TaxID=253017 RepID=UPI001FB09695|nr:long-chain-fatty-acid--AMP ligase FadD23-like [Impatiens glandulifera]